MSTFSGLFPYSVLVVEERNVVFLVVGCDFFKHLWDREFFVAPDLNTVTSLFLGNFLLKSRVGGQDGGISAESLSDVGHPLFSALSQAFGLHCDINI